MPSMVADSGTTSGVGRVNDPLKRTSKKSNKTFIVANGSAATYIELACIDHLLRESARDMDIASDVTLASLASTMKILTQGMPHCSLKTGERFFIQQT